MSFLDEQATGQIGIGEKASLGTLTRTRRKRKKGQRPQGTETYSLLPQNEFTDIVSSPTDITQVGIGQLLTAQGIPASQVKNVFERYQDTGAAPFGDVGDVLYPQPEDDGDVNFIDDDIETQTDPYIPDADPGIGEGDPLGYGDPYNIPEDSLLGGALNVFNDLTTKANETLGQVLPYEPGFVGGEGIGTGPGGAAGSGMGGSSAGGGAGGLGVFGQSEGAGTAQTVAVNAPSVDSGPGVGQGDGGGGSSAGVGGSGIAAVSRGGRQGYSNTGIDSGMFGEPSDPSIPDPPSVSNQSVAEPGTEGPDFFASGGTVKSKNKNSFMSMKGK